MMLSEPEARIPSVLEGADRQFVFGRAALSPEGELELPYRLGNGIELTERISIPLGAPLTDAQLERLSPLADLLHWAAGVSYYKVLPAGRLVFEHTSPGPSQGALVAALYSEGLGEFAYVNDLPSLPSPSFETREPVAELPPRGAEDLAARPSLVCVGGGKDSVVAIAGARAAGPEVSLFSVGDSPPIRRTAEGTGLPRSIASRRIDPKLFELNAAGALNGHVPVTAIVSLIAALTAEANGFGRVVLANERSASTGNTQRYGIDVNHQFSKGERCEHLIRAAIAETGAAAGYFSILRGASELLIARAFSAMTDYHPLFTSCNAVFRIDESRRGTSWCCQCPKCRFVFLVLAPFMERDELSAIFGRDLLEDESQYAEFARLAAIDGFKPFECVGESSEALAAFTMLAESPQWREAPVVRRFSQEVLSRQATSPDPQAELEWSNAPAIPANFEAAIREVLGA